MKKIIKNLVYNTETAHKIGEWQNAENYNDLNFYIETLYRKKTGEFFLHGDGNAASPYSKREQSGNARGTEEIVPLSYEQAREWAEKHLTVEEYIAAFGEPDESDKGKTPVNLYLSNVTVAKLKKQATIAKVSMAEYVENLINNE